MLKKLKELIMGEPSIEKNHVFFGKIVFIGNEKSKGNDYWEAEFKIEGAKEPITVLINVGKDGPDSKHVDFIQNCITDLDALFDKCWPIFKPDFQQWAGKPFSGKWRDDFELVSIEIPKEANDKNEWTVGYFVDAANHYFTARFIDGKPRYNEIDG